jgi:hypothetical protein
MADYLYRELYTPCRNSKMTTPAVVFGGIGLIEAGVVALAIAFAL